MKKIMWICGLLIVGLTSCSKNSDDDSNSVTPAQQAIIDDNAIQAYIKANNITATKDESGLYYSVITPGTGAYPTAMSKVNVNYKGQLTSGSQFDSGNFTVDISIPSGQNGSVIEGWRIGLKKINKGGRLLLLIPSALGYGRYGSGPIPPNAVLVFTIDMISIN